MQALYFDRRLEYRPDYPDPEPVEGEAIVRVRLAGICNTDLEIKKGYMGFQGVPGHEFVGRVESGPDADLVGRRVVGEINAACGQCEWCHRGLGRHCPRRTVLGILGRDGAFADYLQLPAGNLFVLPDDLDDEAAVFVEPVAAAVEILEQIPLEPATPVLVLGDGKLGLLAVLVLAAFGMDVTLVGRHPERAERVVGARARFKKEAAPAGDRFPVVVEATGNSKGFALAQRWIEPRGTIILKSTTAEQPAVNLALTVIDEVTVVGSRCGPFRPAMSLLSQGKVDPRPLIEACYALDRGLEAFVRAETRGSGKVLISMKAGD